MKKLNLKGVDLNLLTVFEAIMETGQLSAAGASLGMSQPAMSAALQRLRLTAKDPLFVRTRQGMEPTPRAREWFEQVQPALEQIRLSLLVGREFDPSTSSRKFSVMAGDYFETLYLSPLLEKLSSAAPGVSLKLLPIAVGGLPESFRLGQVDLAVHYIVPQSMKVTHQSLGEEKLAVIARADHPRLGKKISLKQFQGEKHVLFSAPGEQDEHLNRLLSEQAVEREILVSVSHFSSVASVVESSDAIATVPSSMAHRLTKRYAIQSFAFPLAIPAIPKQLIWPRIFDDDPMHRWFRALLAEVVNPS